MQVQIVKNEKIANWLDECRTLNTRNAYSYRIADFFEWYGDTPESFLELPRNEKRHLVLRYQNEKRGILSINTLSMTLGTINSFLDVYDMKINFKGKRVKTMIDLSSHVFTNGDLSKLFEVANTKEKCFISLASSLGWECSAVLELKRKTLQSYVDRAKEQNVKFFYFMSQRKKTGAMRLGVLNPLALKWLEKWLIESKRIPLRTRNPNRSKRLVVSDLFDLGISGCNAMIRKLTSESHIKTTGRIHSHLIRKWTMGNLIVGGLNEFEAKFLVGKNIPMSDFTYLKSLEVGIKEKYPRIFHKYLNLEVSSMAIVDLTKSLEQKEKELKEQKIQLKKLQENYLSIQKRIKSLSQIRDTSDLLMRDILNDPRFQKLISDKVAEHGGRLELREDVIVDGKADVKIHRLRKEELFKK